MTISLRSAGAANNGSSSLSLAFPATIVAGDLLVLFVANKYPTNGPSTPTDFSAPSNNQFSGGAGTAGIDTGTVYITVFTKIATGSESGNLSVTITNGNSSYGRIFCYQKSNASAIWAIAAHGGADNTAGTSWSVTAGGNPGTQAGDVILVGSAINTDTYTYSSEAISQTGVTAWGTVIEQNDSGTNSGQDCALVVSEHPVQTGTGSANPVFTMTANSSATYAPAGASVFLRLREQPTINGTLTKTLDNVTFESVGKVYVKGAASKTLDSITLQTAGKVVVKGSLSKVLDGITFSSEGKIIVKGSSGVTLDNATLQSAGTVEDASVNGDLSVTLDNVTFSSAGKVVVKGSASPTLGNATINSQGKIIVKGSASPTLDGVTVEFIGKIKVIGGLTKTLDDITISSQGKVVVKGTLSKTLEDAVLSSSGSGGPPAINGELSAALSDAILTAAGKVAVKGSLGVTLSSVTISSNGKVVIIGSLNKTLDNATLQSTGGNAAPITGGLNSQLDDVIANIVGTVPIIGGLIRQLDDAALNAAGNVIPFPIYGELSVILDDATLRSNGQSYIFVAYIIGRTYRIPREDRIMACEEEKRKLIVNKEDRIYKIER